MLTIISLFCRIVRIDIRDIEKNVGLAAKWGLVIILLVIELFCYLYLCLQYSFGKQITNNKITNN